MSVILDNNQILFQIAHQATQLKKKSSSRFLLLRLLNRIHIFLTDLRVIIALFIFLLITLLFFFLILTSLLLLLILIGLLLWFLLGI